MCGSLLSKFKKNSNKVAPMLSTAYLEPKRVPRKTNLAVESIWVDEDMSLDEITLGREICTTVRFPDLVEVIEARPSGDTKATTEENSLLISDKHKVQLVSGSDADYKSKAEAQSIRNATTTLIAERPNDLDPPSLDGQTARVMDLQKQEEQMAAVQCHAHSSSNARRPDETRILPVNQWELTRQSNEIRILTANQGSLDASQSGQCSGFTVQQPIETELAVQNHQALNPIDNNEEKLIVAHSEPQDATVVPKPLSVDRGLGTTVATVIHKRLASVNVTAEENTWSTSYENNKLEHIFGSDAERESKADAQSMEMAVITSTKESFDNLNQSRSQIKVAWGTEIHEEKMAAFHIDALSSSKTRRLDKGSLIAAQSEPFSSSTVQRPIETELAVEDQQILVLTDKHEETVAAFYSDPQVSADVSEPISANGQILDGMNFETTEENMTALSVPQEFVIPHALSTNQNPLVEMATEKHQERTTTVHDGSASLSTSQGSAHNTSRYINRLGPNLFMNREVLLRVARRELEAKILRMTTRSSVKNRELLLAVARKELEKNIFQMTTVQGESASISTTRMPAHPKCHRIRATNGEASLAMARKIFADNWKDKIAARHSGPSSSNTVRSILLGKTKSAIAFEVLDGMKRIQTVILSARLPLSLRRLDEPLPLTAEVLNAKLLRAEENRRRELERVRACARSMARQSLRRSRPS